MLNDNTPKIETDRLILRKFTDNDLLDMFAVYSDTEVNKFLPWFPFKSLDETKTYLHDVIYAEYAKTTAYRYAIEYKANNKVIGYVSINNIDEDACNGDLGYGLAKEFWNNGIITEACRPLLKKLKENGFKFVTATHDTINPASGKVMEKLGMTYINSYDELWQPKNFPVTFKLYKLNFI